MTASVTRQTARPASPGSPTQPPSELNPSSSRATSCASASGVLQSCSPVRSSTATSACDSSLARRSPTSAPSGVDAGPEHRLGTCLRPSRGSAGPGRPAGRPPAPAPAQRRRHARAPARRPARQRARPERQRGPAAIASTGAAAPARPGARERRRARRARPRPCPRAAWRDYPPALAPAGQPFRRRISATACGRTVNRSPTTPKSAISKIGASGSELIATIVPDACMPPRWCTAPETPTPT